ncbi:serine protease 53-like [Sabethes cyaneus]|uniref:serine protease 53-like n=1 Tax=Sabethes cyaneus TaxID=53552 RepID=UPI00237DE5AA|nr:serine protease 53-like [Sabethes cyaneus]
MRFLAIFVVCLYAVLVQTTPVEKEQRIHNGQMAEPGQFPYAAGLILATGICGGSLISPNYVLTAAQCIVNVEKVTVVLGSTRIFDQTDENQVRLEATQLLVHPGYEIAGEIFDVGLVQLPSTVTIYRPIRLPNLRQVDATFVGQEATVIGWGFVGNSGPQSPDLLFARMPVVSVVSCRLSLPTQQITDNHICTNSELSAPCSQDYGSPLTVVDVDGITTQIGTMRGLRNILLLTFSVVAVAAVYPSAPTGSQRISGGTIASPTDVPWAVGVIIHGGTSGHDFCSGVLISSRFVLTAANCISGANTVTVALDAADFTSIGTLIGVSNVLIHPNFSWLLGRDDIAILTLNQEAPINDSTIRAVQMPRRSDVGKSFVDWVATTAGWGNTGNRDNEPIPTQHLQFATDTVTSNLACQLSYTWVRSTHICVATNNGGPCNGDEGGPVTVREAGRIVLIGIHSFHFNGIRGCDRGRSAVHTRITEYLDWIEANTDVIIPA